MAIEAEHEAPRAPTSTAFSDAVTFAFGDPDAGAYGVARLGLSSGAEGEPQASGLAVVFDGTEAVAVRAAGGLAVAERDWPAIDAAGLSTSTEEPLAAWRVAFTAEDPKTSFDLRFEALAAPAEIAAGSPVSKAGGMEGYEQLCRVTGTANVNGAARDIACLGQRGHSWGAPDWDRLALARTISAWMGDDLGVTLTAVRPASAATHADEVVAAAIVGPAISEIEDARLSTTYDGDGRQRRASLELYEDDEGYARRAGGEVVCGTSLDLGSLRLDCAFFRWRMEGREGIGRYDVLRKPG